MCWVEFFRKKFLKKGNPCLPFLVAGGVCQTAAQAPYLEFFKFRFLLFIAFS